MGLLVAIAVPVLLIGLLLAMPVHFHFALHFTPWPRGRVTIHWLCGLVQHQVHSQPGRRPRRPSKRWSQGLRLARRHGQDLAVLVWHFLKQLRRYVRFDDLRLSLRLGTGDPAETAWLVGWLLPLQFLLTAAQRLQIEADFEEPTLQGSCQGSVCVVPLGFLFAALVVVCSSTFLRLLWALVTRR